MARVGPLAGVDIDALFNALRPRIVGLLSGYTGGGGTGPGAPGAPGPPGPPGPKGVTWRGEWSADTDYEVGDLVYLETAGAAVLTFMCLTAQTSHPGAEPTVGGDENWWELGPGYLIIDGSRAMTGDLNMDGHAVDSAIALHLTGDDDDDEARIDGAERIVFNAEPTKSVLENPSRIELNPGVAAGTDYTAAEGRVSWDSVEDVLIAYVASGAGVVLIALGWAASIARNGYNPA